MFERRKRAYRPRTNNDDEMIEMVAGTSTPTGRIFRLVKENENLTGKETIQIRDPLTGILKTYVYSYNE
jgi:hypothetical protein